MTVPISQKSRNDSSYQLTQNRKNPEMTVPISLTDTKKT
jgi:hypothetical protein